MPRTWNEPPTRLTVAVVMGEPSAQSMVTE